MRSRLFIGLVILQLIAIGAVLVPAEYKAATATTTIWLRTHPVDPMDLMRGHYAVVTYDISRVEDYWDESDPEYGKAPPLPRVGDVVFVKLAQYPGKFMMPVGVSASQPENMPFIRGRVTGLDSRRRMINVVYGIEKIFISEKKARTIEGSGGPFRVVVRLNPDGTPHVVSLGPIKR